jgi:hypothetical protein
VFWGGLIGMALLALVSIVHSKMIDTLRQRIERLERR